MKTIISAEHISKKYRTGQHTITALDDVSLEVPGGTFTAVMGRSGSGKSTLLKALGTLIRPDCGSIRLGDKDITGLSDRELCRIRRQNIGFVFQQYQLLPEYSVWDNICMPLYLDHVTPDEKYLRDMLERLGLWDRWNVYPEQLSGGEQQRISLIRAMAHKPQIILADEPTGSLDYQTGQEVLQALMQAGKLYEQTIVMVTHDSECAAYADRILVMEDGQMRGQGES